MGNGTPRSGTQTSTRTLLRSKGRAIPSKVAGTPGPARGAPAGLGSPEERTILNSFTNGDGDVPFALHALRDAEVEVAPTREGPARAVLRPSLVFARTTRVPPNPRRPVAAPTDPPNPPARSSFRCGGDGDKQTSTRRPCLAGSLGTTRAPTRMRSDFFAARLPDAHRPATLARAEGGRAKPAWERDPRRAAEGTGSSDRRGKGLGSPPRPGAGRSAKTGRTFESTGTGRHGPSHPYHILTLLRGGVLGG